MAAILLISAICRVAWNYNGICSNTVFPSHYKHCKYYSRKNRRRQ
jgi:hypothetical protein